MPTAAQTDHRESLANALMHESAGRLEDAAGLYRTILDADPAHGDANHRMGLLAGMMRHPELGLPYLEAAIEADPQNRDYWISYVEGLICANRLEEARTVLGLACDNGLDGADVAALVQRLAKPVSPTVNTALRRSSSRPAQPEKSAIASMVESFERGDLGAAEQAARKLHADFPDHWAGCKMLGVVLSRTGRFKEAIEFLQRTVERVPADAENHCNLGIAYLETGDIGRAEASFRKAVQINRRYAPAHCNLGATLHAQGDRKGAESAYRTALALDPKYFKALSNLGALLIDRQDYEEAEACYRRALAIQGNDGSVRRSLAIALDANGRGIEAEEFFRSALVAQPGDPANYLGLAAIFAGRYDYAAAENILRKGLSVAPNSVELTADLGGAVLAQERFDEAERLLRTAIDLEPGHADSLCRLGVCLKRSGRHEEAEEMLRRALELRPGNKIALDALGGTLAKLDRLDEAEHVMRRSLTIDHDAGQAHLNLGFTLRLLDRYPEAEKCFRRAGELGIPVARVTDAMMLPAIMGTKDDVAAWRKRFESRVDELLAAPPRLDDPQDFMLAPNFFLAYHGMNDRELQGKVANFYLAACPALGWVAPHVDRPAAGKSRLKIGIFSHYLFSHSVSTCYSRLILGLSRDPRFELVLITNNRIDMSIYAGFEGGVLRVPDRFLQARQDIANQELDALIYLDIGMEPTSYFMAFARLARLQCVLAGHPVTTGIPNVDCFLSAEGLEIEAADSHYTERLVRLPQPPHIFSPPAVPSTLKSRSALGLPASGHLYVCPMKLQKLHPDFDEALGRILDLDDQGVVVLFADNRRDHWKGLLQERFEKTLSPQARERVVFLPWIADYQDFVSVVIHADVVIDPFHFGIGSTAIVIGVTGTPLVTRPSDYMRGRAGVYYTRLLGIEDCILADCESYARKAVEIACNPAVRSELVARILRNGSKLFNDERPIADVADFLLRELV